MIKTYLELSKARLCTMVLITTLVGYILAADRVSADPRLLWTLLGTALTAFGANALNQLLEKDIDVLMERTRHRPLPTGKIGTLSAAIWGIGTSLLGTVLLAWLVGWLPAALALGTVVLYVLVYTPLKRISTLNTAVGAICGAIPPLIGWSAAVGRLELGAWLLFVVMIVWQMPHFFALAWLYRGDYARADLRMLPVVEPSGRLTFRVLLLFALLMLPLIWTVFLAGVAGLWFTAGGMLLAGWWVVLSLRLYRSKADADARRVFLASLLVLPLTLGLLVVDRGSGLPLRKLPLAPQVVVAQIAQIAQITQIVQIARETSTQAATGDLPGVQPEGEGR